MTYKSFLTVVTNMHGSDAALQQTAALARAGDGYAEALCLGVDRSQIGYYYAAGSAGELQATLNQARSEAAEILGHANDILGASGARWSTDEAVAQIADLGRHVAYRARFSDLVIQSRPYGDAKGVELAAVVEAALFEGRAPVLVIPDDYDAKSRFRTVVVGWNDSQEAMTAIRKALPMLEQAELVRIAIVDPQAYWPDRSEPGSLLAQMLARHGITCEIDVLSNSKGRISDVLNRQISDTGADLLVMGAYGHSRFREAILGGATRNLLEQATVPVLMAH